MLPSRGAGKDLSMGIQRLVAMANQIGGFFASTSDPDEAAQAVAQHLKSFWVPAMRHELIAYQKGGGSGLTDVVSKALQILETQEQNEHNQP